MISLFSQPIDPASVKLISALPLIVEVTPPKTNDPAPINDPAPVKVEDKPRNRIVETITYLGQGAAFGYGIYWLVRLGDKLGFVSDASRPLINPYGYILAGLIRNAIIQTASLTYEAALAVLGERIKYDNKVLPENSPRLERFRQHSWKVITKIENIIEKVDTKFSEFCGIRTAKELSNLEAPLKKDQTLVLNTIEIVRRVLGKELKQIFSNNIPLALAVCSVQVIGFAVVGGHITLGSYLIIEIVFSIFSNIAGNLKPHYQLENAVKDTLNQLNSPPPVSSKAENKTPNDLVPVTI